MREDQQWQAELTLRESKQWQPELALRQGRRRGWATISYNAGSNPCEKGSAQWQRTLALCKMRGWATISCNAGSRPCEKEGLREAGGEAGARVSLLANASGNSACEKNEQCSAAARLREVGGEGRARCRQLQRWDRGKPLREEGGTAGATRRIANTSGNSACEKSATLREVGGEGRANTSGNSVCEKSAILREVGGEGRARRRLLQRWDLGKPLREEGRNAGAERHLPSHHRALGEAGGKVGARLYLATLARSSACEKCRGQRTGSGAKWQGTDELPSVTVQRSARCARAGVEETHSCEKGKASRQWQRGCPSVRARSRQWQRAATACLSVLGAILGRSLGV